MFHPHYLRLFFGIPHSTADAMTLVAALKVEQDHQEAWREEREREQRDVERIPRHIHSGRRKANCKLKLQKV